MIATVIVAKCTYSKDSFGIRPQKENNDWIWTWSFKLTNKTAKREGYDRTTISGRILLDKNYPGCPYCGEKNFAQCGYCYKIMCLDNNFSEITCPSCGNHSRLKKTDTFENISGDMF